MNNEEARAHMEARMTMFEQRLTGVSSEVHQLKQSMDANTEALKEYIELSKNFKLIMKFTSYIEKIAVWVAKVAAAGGILFACWKFLVVETIKNFPNTGR